MLPARRFDKARKRLAVPFRAAHTPAKRSEWSHPEVALLLTHLATYHSSLSQQELLAALDVLLAMGRSAQEDYYRAWLQLSRPWIREGEPLGAWC
jgi:hypothetical protein